MDNTEKRLFSELNSAQREAVTYEGGPLLVLAGAGSGKTRVLTHRAAWLILSKKFRSDRLLLLTFTNKAAGEMKERLINLLGGSAPGLFAGTFHSFCAYILRRDGEEIGIQRTFVIYDDDDQNQLIKRLLKKYNLSDQKFKLPMVKSVIESAKNDLLTPKIFLETARGDWLQYLGLIYREYQKELSKANALDFNDLLIAAVNLFKKKEKILEKYQNRYRQILVDEYQDTNRAQYFLTKLLAREHKNLTVVGDAAQAIYGWRGADYRNLMSLKTDFPETKVINLEENYRSTKTILDAANAVIEKNIKHPTLKLFTSKGKGERILVYRSSSETDEANFVAEKIKQLVDFQGVDPTRIAILYRTNAQSRTFEESFIKHNLPYILIGGVKFYERAEVKDVISLVRVFYNPVDSVSWERIFSHFGVKRREKIEKFIEKEKSRKWLTRNLLEKILEASCYLEKFDPGDEDDYRRLENIRELTSVAEGFPDIGDFLENIALVQQEYSSQEKEKYKISGEAVRLMTLHSSKGLEFEAVFMVGMEEGLLPHMQSIDEPDRLEEERRLCYVGITRAKKFLFLTYTASRLYFGKTNYNQVSRFLKDIPENLCEVQEDKLGWGGDSDSDDWDEEEW